MRSDVHHTARVPMIRLLGTAVDEFSGELQRRLHEAGLADIRPGHGCVFGTIDPEGSRLTDLALRARMTKQSVAEATNDLEQLGYVERVPDPDDGRVKIIRPAERMYMSAGSSTLPNGSRWRSGFRLIRPRSRAVVSPNRSAA